MNNQSLRGIVIYVIIFSIVAFILGSAYQEGKMKKIIQYCVKEYPNNEAILDFVYEATYIDPNDWR